MGPNFSSEHGLEVAAPASPRTVTAATLLTVASATHTHQEDTSRQTQASLSITLLAKQYYTANPSQAGDPTEDVDRT